MRTLALAAVLALAGGLTACGGTSSTSGGSVSVGSGTDLTVVYADGAGKTATWRLTCEPAGGDHPDPAAACAALARGGKTGLAPVPAGTICTELFGGPQTARITGSWNGEQVDASLKRSNGCEISRWEALSGLLPADPADPAATPRPTPS